MTVAEALKQWDGKSVKGLEEIYESYRQDSQFSKQLVVLIVDRPTSHGATWLLKRFLEDENKLLAAEVKKLFSVLDQLDVWESKLHILQSLPYLIIGKSDKKGMERFLRACLSETNKFVRAWAYNGFYELAQQHPEYQEEVRQFFEMAMRDEAPSVKSRIRNIMKKGF